ncbi:nucleoside triphosphate pyrophosphatase [Accumulibacter sp.]|uniref:Maf family protein n=1 Tax=Accumulibacter sp. TaxID=2053492 RepID=UPI0025F14974|nr:Maf family protein [Accumulibacter sp.]MDS4048083.1 Maf family protein [Accumulibacter sp.]
MFADGLPSIYLASRSPRRCELLAQIGVRFATIIFRDPPREDAAVDETPLPGEDAPIYVERLARNKAAHGWRLVAARRLAAHRPVLAADTTLELAGELIGKPRDGPDAVRILQRLSGKTHRVLTAVAIGSGERLEVALSISEVRFRRLDEREIRRYVATGEPMDKAGAYAIQGRGALFVEYLAGSYSGVMGLPLCETGRLLRHFGCLL